MGKFKSGRHKSAQKEARKTVVRTLHNVSVKSNIRTLAKKLHDAVIKKDMDLAKSLLKEVSSQWDKAAKRNVIHKNAANNKKARMAKLVNSLTAKKK